MFWLGAAAGGVATIAVILVVASIVVARIVRTGWPY